MNHELYEQGPETYLPFLLYSLIFTVLAYAAFPIFFAKIRTSPVTKKKYKRLCYGINAAVMFVFIVINGGVSNGFPYFLWTWIFSNQGTKMLREKAILIEGNPVSPKEEPTASAPEKAIEPDNIAFCRKCGDKLIDGSKFCRKCGTKVEKE